MGEYLRNILNIFEGFEDLSAADQHWVINKLQEIAEPLPEPVAPKPRRGRPRKDAK